MKKLVYIAAIAFAASMVACGGNKAADAAEAVDSVAAVVEEVAVAVDTCACDSCACDTCACAGAAAEVVEAVAE